MEKVQNMESEIASKLESEKKDETPNEKEEKKSALHGSINEYGTNSYYYAHAPKEFDVGKGKR
eukprot:CAMPEP_0197003464 /NCGR_PEP_ID=MMETSP1380-20130617/7726_1 /TAXON_ID=5936 /ORGANISM="Euplotes crassus, Strain CT5" /LENGTH=62 /DNA_ID=CAMNT_0042421981 /DNA_START=1 /DNA_END=189 /DNA_ORIENTATION=+